MKKYCQVKGHKLIGVDELVDKMLRIYVFIALMMVIVIILIAGIKIRKFEDRVTQNKELEQIRIEEQYQLWKKVNPDKVELVTYEQWLLFRKDGLLP